MKMKINIPSMLYIETTNICNANCIFCAYQYDTRPKTTIELGLLKKVILEYKKVGGMKISLSPFAGEVFVDPNILVFIRYIASIGFDLIYTYTNALLFHKFDIEDILTSGLTSINISLAPLDEETYIKIYRNKNYKQLLENISTFLQLFNSLETKTIKNVSIEFRSNMTLKEIQLLKDYKVYIQPYLNSNIQVHCMQTFDSWMGVISKNDLLDGMKIKDHNFHKPTPCLRLNMLQVLANGDTRICGCRYDNNAKEDIFHIGNANNENIIDMYNKQKVYDIKQSFYDNKLPRECEMCSWYEEVRQ